MKSKLQKDIKLANTEYKRLIKEIEDNYTKSGEYQWVGSDNKVIIRDFLEQLESLRVLDEKKLLAFSEFLKSKDGQKNIFMFYQKEMLPKYDPFIENYFTSGNPAENPAVVFEILELTSFYRREITFDVKKVKQIFSDSSIHIHFLFLTKVPFQNLDVTRRESLSHHNIRYEEQSEDIYNAFNEVAAATGGFVGSSQNTASVFQKAVAASDNYYLLYYSPRNYKSDGQFKSIEVKVKGRSYRTLHRAGYLAD
jgi:ribosome-associated translation inhibitor RaiA